MLVKSKKEIEILTEGGKRLADILQKVAETVKPGITTQELDRLAESLIVSVGGTPSFKGYKAFGAATVFPAALCTSVNEEVVHGIPSVAHVLKEGDIIGLDIGMKYKGLYTDTAITVGVGGIDAASQKLIGVSNDALFAGIAPARPGAFTGDIGEAIQTYAEGRGFGVVRELVGHGVGHKVHEDPEVPNWGSRGHGVRLKEGMVLAIEPMVTAGSYAIELARDGWTWVTKDHSRSAHFEHTIMITGNGAEILTEYSNGSMG